MVSKHHKTKAIYYWIRKFYEQNTSNQDSRHIDEFSNYSSKRLSRRYWLTNALEIYSVANSYIEKKKFNMHNLCQKFLTPEKSTLIDDEIFQFNELLKLRECRKFFLQNLNLLRNRGTFKIYKDNHLIIGKFLNVILSSLEMEKLDFYCSRGVIILSQTFYQALYLI